MALALSGQGVPVFPVHPIGAGTAAKAPATPRGFYDATTDATIITAWWEDRSYGVAIVPQSVGLVVIDIDIKGKHDGVMSWRAWCSSADIDPENHPHTLRTPSGGLHLYYVAPAGDPIAAQNGLLPGVDVRGMGGYVLVHSGVSDEPYEILQPKAWRASSWHVLPVDLPRVSGDADRVLISESDAGSWLAALSAAVPLSSGMSEAIGAEIGLSVADVATGGRHEAGLKLVSELIHRGREGQLNLDMALGLARTAWLDLGDGGELQERSLEWDAIVLWALSADKQHSTADEVAAVKQGYCTQCASNRQGRVRSEDGSPGVPY